MTKIYKSKTESGTSQGVLNFDNPPVRFEKTWRETLTLAV